MHSTKRLWTPEARARKHLKLGPNTILAIMRHGCSILTATISRSFKKGKLIFIVLMLNGRSRSQRHALCQRTAALQSRWLVERLLKAHDQLGDFLEQPAPEAVPEANAWASVGEKPGDRIGRYKLLQQIGE